MSVVRLEGQDQARELRLAVARADDVDAFAEEAAARGLTHSYDAEKDEVVMGVGDLTLGEIYRLQASLALRLAKPWESRPDGGRK